MDGTPWCVEGKEGALRDSFLALAAGWMLMPFTQLGTWKEDLPRRRC